jgi:ribosomal protein S18 acetylase RimI-like enzyme
MASGRSTPADGLRLEVASYDHPDVVRFVDAVQAFYVERYGGADRTPVTPDEFAPPHGLFLLGRLGERAVCCGGWRCHDAATIAPADARTLRPGDAEIKRMWVEQAYRRRGLARRILAELEATAAANGCRRMVLETGTEQPEAVAFYRRSGYERIDRFGVYRDDASSLCFARELPPRTSLPTPPR